MVEPILLLQPFELVHHMTGRTDIIAVPVDRLRTRVAFIRTAPGGADVERKIAMMPHPDFPVAFDIYQVPGRHRQTVEILHYLPWCASPQNAIPQKRQPCDR